MENSAAGVRTEDAFKALLRRSVLVTAPVGIVCAVVAAVRGGGAGAVSALIGAVIVVFFFGARLVVMRRMVSRNPQLFLVSALTVYTVKIVALGLAMVLLTRIGWVHGPALGVTVLVCAVVWLAVEMHGFVHLRIPIFVAPESSDAPASEPPAGRPTSRTGR